MNQPIIELKHVDLAPPIGMDLLLTDISFAINQGEKIALVGTSGSGKTTLLRLLNRLVSPRNGSIHFEGQSYAQHSVFDLRRQVVLVPQEPQLLGMLGKEALIYPLKLQKLSKDEIRDRTIKYCDALKIPQTWLEKTELQLSLGQRQLLTIARGLMMEPKVLLLDEPTSALDGGKRDLLVSVLNQISLQQSTTMIMVNHQLDACAQFAQRILFLDSGKLQEDTPASPQKWQQVETRIRASSETAIQEWEEE